MQRVHHHKRALVHNLWDNCKAKCAKLNPVGESNNVLNIEICPRVIRATVVFIVEELWCHLFFNKKYDSTGCNNIFLQNMI